MNVLVLGAGGHLGKHICKALQCKNVCYSEYFRGDTLESVDWNKITHIINCVAKTPCSNATLESYWVSNVSFVERLIPFCVDKYLIHFSSFSEFYKNDFYQKTKLLSSALIYSNSHLFQGFQIIPVPTLDDAELISSLSKRSMNSKIVVDTVIYSYIETPFLANLVAESIEANEKLDVTKYLSKKNLFQEVCCRGNPENITEGVCIDRTSVVDGAVTITSNLKELI